MSEFDPFARPGVPPNELVENHGASPAPIRPDPASVPYAPEPTEDQLAPAEGEWYQPYPERPRLRVLPEARWPKGLPGVHRLRWPARFYVEASTGTVGLVPWPGSHVVWPWEAGWYPNCSAVTADAKPEKVRKR